MTLTLLAIARFVWAQSLWAARFFALPLNRPERKPLAWIARLAWEQPERRGLAFISPHMGRARLTSIRGWRREGVALPHILNSRKVLQVPRNMKAAHVVIAKGNYVINMMIQGAGEIDLPDLRLKSGQGCPLDVRLPRGDVVSIPLRVGVLPSSLGLEVALPIGGLPRLGSFVRFGCGLRIVQTRALFNLTASSAIVFLPFNGARIAAFDAGSVGCLSSGVMPIWARLSGIKCRQTEALSLFASDDIHNHAIQQAELIANGEFNFTKGL